MLITTAEADTTARAVTAIIGTKASPVSTCATDEPLLVVDAALVVVLVVVEALLDVDVSDEEGDVVSEELGVSEDDAGGSELGSPSVMLSSLITA